jgi:hypothetical protein
MNKLFNFLLVFCLAIMVATPALAGVETFETARQQVIVDSVSITEDVTGQSLSEKLRGCFLLEVEAIASDDDAVDVTITSADGNPLLPAFSFTAAATGEAPTTPDTNFFMDTVPKITVSGFSETGTLVIKVKGIR